MFIANIQQIKDTCNLCVLYTYEVFAIKHKKRIQNCNCFFRYWIGKDLLENYFYVLFSLRGTCL